MATSRREQRTMTTTRHATAVPLPVVGTATMEHVDAMGDGTATVAPIRPAAAVMVPVPVPLATTSEDA